MNRSLLFAFVAIPWCASSAESTVSGFLDQHCIDCHDPDVKKGGLDLTALTFDRLDDSTAEIWQDVFRRVRDGEMPPKKKSQPEGAERSHFLGVLKEPLLKFDAEEIASKGRVRSRRLTRTEYEHTLHDLLGSDIPLRTLLPEDQVSHGFETVADGQQLSHHQLARYLDVADLALSEAFNRALKGDQPFEKFVNPKALSKSKGGNYRGPELRNGESISWPIGVQFFGRMTETSVPEDGWYRITLKGVHGINPGTDGAVWGTLRSGECYSNAPLLFLIGLVEATAKPRDLVYEAWIEKGHMLELKPNDGTINTAPTGANGGNVSFEGRDLAKQGFEGIAHKGIELKRIHPNADQVQVRKRLFGDKNPEALKLEDLDELVLRFATQAFRRPVSAEQCEPYQQIAHHGVDEGHTPAEALRTAYRAVLCSPRFLSFIEMPGPLDDHAIASRLSYALWVSMPDEDLIQLAREKQLHDPKVLAQQVERLLKDKKADRFVKSFTDQWLKLNQIDFTTPDARQFRRFDPIVQQSMLEETRAYFAELIRGDLSVSHFVDSDFAFINGRLAKHYAGENPMEGKGADLKKDKRNKSEAQPEKNPVVFDLTPGKGLQKVSLKPEAKRGGLVTQGAILKVTADGTSTSPVVRGVFINERILGNHIPPPPPGIPAIEPDIRGATSIRDQLDKHRNNESCASCHQTIDPPGFALENYDPVGIWRSAYGQQGKGVRVDPAGVTPDGGAFRDLSDWKQIYVQHPQKLARGFARQFLTYATGAPPRFSDEPALDEIGNTTTNLRSILCQVILSDSFRTK